MTHVFISHFSESVGTVVGTVEQWPMRSGRAKSILGMGQSQPKKITENHTPTPALILSDGAPV